MPTNDFLPFATGGGALVESQANFLAAAWRTGGFEAGIADPAKLNKVWRQSAFMSAAVAQLISDRLVIDVLDDGDLPGLVADLDKALKVDLQSGAALYAATTGGPTTYAASLTPAPAALTDGLQVNLKVGTANNASPTLNLNSLGAKPIYGVDGTTALGAGMMPSAAVLRYSTAANAGAGGWLLLNPQSSEAEATLASAATTNLGGQSSHLIQITGTTAITSFGSSASTNDPIYLLRFAGALTLTHNATSLILPGGQNIKTAANDIAFVQYLGSGNWRVLDYERANGQPVSPTGAEVTLASAATTDLGSAGSNLVQITGTTAITSFGSSASTANPLYRIRFAGALTLTHNATSMILPGGANVAVQAGDAALAQYLGSGNWKVLDFAPVAGQVTPAGLAAAIAAAAAPVESGELSAANGTTGSFSHGLGGVPKRFMAVLRCKTAENGYSIGDEIFASFAHADAAIEMGVNVYANATFVGYRVGDEGIGLLSPAGVWFALTPANWRLVLRAWAN